MQPDTLVPDPANTLDWDRYQYVQSNPLRYTDPLGTPGVVIRPMPTSTPSPVQAIADNPAGDFPFDIDIQWQQTDWIDFSIDFIGLVGDSVKIVGPTGEVVFLGSLSIEAAGLIKSLYELYQGDPKSLFIDLITLN